MKTKKNEFGLVVRASTTRSPASGAALLIQMSEGNVEKSLRQIYSVGAAVDLYLAVRGYSRQCHINQIIEE